ILLLFGFIPGMPTIPFIALAVVTGAVGLSARKPKHAGAATEPEAADEPKRKEQEDERLKEALQIDALELEIGYGLIGMVDPQAPANLLDRITVLRRQTALDQ